MLRYRDESRTLEWLGFGRGRRPNAGPDHAAGFDPLRRAHVSADVYRLAYYLTRSVA